MQCRIIATGEVKHFANNDNTAHSLIKAGVLELVEHDPGDWVRVGNGAVLPKQAPAPAPQWNMATVALPNSGQRVPAITLTIGTHTQLHWTGEPKGVQNGQAFGKRLVPKEILEAYTKRHKDFWTAERQAAIARDEARADAERREQALERAGQRHVTHT